MNTTRLGPILVLAIFGLTTPSLADQLWLTQISYDVGGDVIGSTTDFDTFHDENTINGYTEDDVISGHGAHDVLAGGSLAPYTDYASAGFSAKAKFGTLGVEFDATTQSQNSTVIPDDTTANVSGTVSASWEDITTLDSDILTPGTPLRATAKLILSGSVSAVSFGGISPGAHYTGGSVTATLEGIGFPAPTQEADSNDNIAHSFIATQQPQGVIEIQIDTIAGEAEDFGEKLTVSGNAGARTIGSFPPSPGAVGTSVGAALGGTLRWGGITSVIDLDTGLPVENWTVTSASGFDYSKPAPEFTPEPATITLIAIAMFSFPAVHLRPHRPKEMSR
jgi:hypothetical protein